MTNAYASLTALKSGGSLNISGTGDDTRLRRLLEHVSRQGDNVCQRHFFSFTQTKEISGSGFARILLSDDLISVTTLKEDDNLDGTYNIT